MQQLLLDIRPPAQPDLELFGHERRGAGAAREIDDFFCDLSDAVTGAPPERLQQRSADTGEYLFEPGVVKVLLSFREDFLAQVAGFRTLVSAIHGNYHRLEPMTREQGEDAVQGAGGHLLDDRGPGGRDAICQGILQRVAPASRTGAVTVDPALLSLFCSELNEARRWGNALIDDEAVRSAAASEIIPRFYTARMSEVGEATSRFVEDWLVLPSHSRASVAEETAIQAGASPEDLDLLIRKRLLFR